MTFDQLIVAASARGASDIHLRAGHVPLVRINGDLEQLYGRVQERYGYAHERAMQEVDAFLDRQAQPAENVSSRH